MTDATIPHLLLNDGRRIAQIGFGTWPLDDAQAETAVQAALACGYRMLDTAARYGNETGVGRGIAASGVPRAEVCITSKLRGSEHGYDSTLRAFDATLAALGTDYLDLYLIHWPLPMRELYVDTWRAFVRLRGEGRIRSIGVSNFQPAHIERLRAETGVLPAVNQVELHPDFSQAALRAWHAAQGIVIESWSPLGRGALLQDATVARLAQKHGRSAAQILLRWHVQHGLVAIPKSQDPARMRQNLALFDFALDADDLAALALLDGAHRQGGDPDTNLEL
ncbi:aldo/keto reductase [Janthinobacterium sp. SUN118]|uniref:aldo/keto reductase n=1 Tax=Janthinobacterium sp. SUN118 TaxID=3004100 RepID=UPI0025B0E3CB|nr:aldo/keto reductase [Janthinobacterium sp. SUN118]MDN2708619.1 aldo/keto reductase [Janthinobacterium sp. SUN118]